MLWERQPSVKFFAYNEWAYYLACAFSLVVVDVVDL